ncbi:DNA (cytosine-5)-methyltransferase 1 [Streptomyces sp. SolWspMP-5a-2]|nr:DNA (cytosine-5)-methyltransferase 1 [Streptomyces sp. SolWspMP-5a-2]
MAADVLGHQVTGIEWDGNACATREAAGLDTFRGDVRAYRAAFFPRAQVLTGGPPCQTFTVAGHGAGRRALDQVVGYIDRLHEAVRTADGDWKRIFRTWRAISEELRRKAVLAEEVKERKRGIEARRAVTRKALQRALEDLGTPGDEIRSVLKSSRAERNLDLKDEMLETLVVEFDTLGVELHECRQQLEELGDERTGLVLQPLWWVIERSRRPGSNAYEAVVLEQVQAVMPVWEKYAEVLGTLGYRTRTQLMLTEAFGVPQTRKRAVLMARLGETEVSEVAETHERYRSRNVPSGAPTRGRAEPPLWDLGEQSTDRSPKAAWVSMEAALKKARGIDPELPDRPAFTVVSNYGTGGDPGARGRRDHDVPSSTITGKVSRNRLCHKGTDIDLPRFERFAPAEAGVLQSFPVSYPWRGSDRSQQIGNAVPPRLALHVLRQVLEPGLGHEEARARAEQAVSDLENWRPPSEPVRARTHGDLAGHPLTGR